MGLAPTPGRRESMRCGLQKAKDVLMRRAQKPTALPVLRVCSRSHFCDTAHATCLAMQRTGFKLGVRLPTCIKSATKLDRENGNTWWADTLQKERTAVMVAFVVQPVKVGNAPLTAPTSEKCYVVAGDEFGPDLKGRMLKIVCALYGLKSAGAAFCAHLASILRTFLKFQPCQAAPDVWMRRAHTADGNPYYAYILAYVHDVIGDPEIVGNILHHKFCPDAAEPIPPSAPEPLDNEVQLNIFCDAAHATCLATRRSTTGISIFLNGGPIRWYSKRQNTIESSTSGSEFVAMKIAMEMNAALQNKLLMMDVPIEGASNTFGDNASAI
jgi:hypothetical protein